MNWQQKDQRIISNYLIVNDDMDIRRVSAPANEYYHLMRLSILRALKWLEENVLVDPQKGYHLRRNLRNFRFDRNYERYLRNSYLYWSGLNGEQADYVLFPKDGDNRLLNLFNTLNNAYP